MALVSEAQDNFVMSYSRLALQVPSSRNFRADSPLGVSSLWVYQSHISFDSWYGSRPNLTVFRADERRWSSVLARDFKIMDDVCFIIVAEQKHELIVGALKMEDQFEDAIPGWRGLLLKSVTRALIVGPKGPGSSHRPFGTCTKGMQSAPQRQ